MPPKKNANATAKPVKTSAPSLVGAEPKSKANDATVAKARVNAVKAANAASASIQKYMKIKPLKANTDPMPVVATGSFVVDNLIGGTMSPSGKGRICPGFPRKRISEVFGAESSGKTTLMLQTIANLQKAGGSVLFLDYEHALAHGYAKTLGVKFDDTLLLYQPDTLEDGLKMIYLAIKGGIDLIVVDSLAAMVPKDELEKGVADVAKVGAVAKKMAETLPKLVQWLGNPPPGAGGTAFVFINQTRALIQTGGGGHGASQDENTAGGKAVKFYSYLRLKLTKIRSDRAERIDRMTGKKRNYNFGNVVDVKIVKNKADGTQGHNGTIFIRYGYGIDDIRTLIEAAVTCKLVKKNGAQFVLGNQQFRGQESLRAHLLKDTAVYNALYTKTTEALLASAPSAVSDDEALELEQDTDAGFQSTFDVDNPDDDGGEDGAPVEATLSAEDVGEDELEELDAAHAAPADEDGTEDEDGAALAGLDDLGADEE